MTTLRSEEPVYTVLIRAVSKGLWPRSMEPIEHPGRQVGVNRKSQLHAGSEEWASTMDAFEKFFTAEHPRAVRLAWLLTRSEAAAEDLAQEALLATYQRFAELDEPAAFLTRVLVNRCRSWQRKAVSTRRVLRSVPHSEITPDSSGDLEVLDAISRLPYRQQVVIVARYWGGWSEKEIANALECRPGTVKSLASRAVDQLRKELAR